MNPLPLHILGTGSYLPEQAVHAHAFDERFGLVPGTTAQQTGVQVRHVAAPGDTSSGMAVLAARRALLAAGLEPQELDCIVSACSLMEQPIPCLAALVHRELGLGESGVAAFDVNATCLSFVVALDLVACALAVGRYRQVLIVSSELPSLGINPDDPQTAALFGDGAAAVVVGVADAGSDSRVLASHLATYSVGAQLCQIRGGGTRLRSAPDAHTWRAATQFEMDGRATFRLTARHFPGFLQTLLARAGVAAADLDCIVPHQASGLALDHITKVLGLPPHKVVRVIEHCGNQVAASIPTALHHAVENGVLVRGQLVALLGTGAGLSMGGVVLRY